jgi:hypothetical protein
VGTKRTTTEFDDLFRFLVVLGLIELCDNSTVSPLDGFRPVLLSTFDSLQLL